MTFLTRAIKTFPRVSLFVAGSTVLASCLCGSGSNGSSSSRGCGDIDLEPHCDAGAPVPHGQQTGSSFLFSCTVACDTGYFDCDGDSINGCEATTKCTVDIWDSGFGDGSATPSVTLDDAPRGLAVCGGVAYVLDGVVVKSFSPKDLAETPLAFLLTPPAGGLACDPSGGVVFTETGSDAVAPTLVHVGADAATAFGAVSDPGTGVLADDGGVFWPEKSDAGSTLVRWGDDAATPLGPVDLSAADKPFARSAGQTYVLQGGTIATFGDASVPSWDGGPFNALAVGDGVVASGPAPDGGSTIVGFGDGGTAFTTKSPRVVRALRRDGQETFVGFEDAVGRLSPSGVLVMYALNQKHVVDIGFDAAWIYWITLGDGSESPQLHRAKR